MSGHGKAARSGRGGGQEGAPAPACRASRASGARTRAVRPALTRPPEFRAACGEIPAAARPDRGPRRERPAAASASSLRAQGHLAPRAQIAALCGARCGVRWAVELNHIARYGFTESCQHWKGGLPHLQNLEIFGFIYLRRGCSVSRNKRHDVRKNKR